MIKYLILALALQFANVDRDFVRTADYAACRDTLLNMLPQAAPGDEKAEVLWRLSRAWLMLGESAAYKDAKRSCFAEGIRYAESAIAENPSNPQGYMWHCANTGRDCQTRNVMDQAAAVPKMTADLTTILDKLGRTDCSEAWQALSEIYWAHPFKSSDSAVNFARKAALTIPSGELRIATLVHLAKLLHKRNWSAAKRSESAASNAGKFAAPGQSNIERYASFNGAPEPQLACPWNPVAYTALSDREEALAIIAYAQRIYRRCSAPTPIDKNDMKELNKLLKQWE